MPRMKQSRIMFFLLPLIVLLMLAVWSTRPRLDEVVRVEAQDGVWDLTGIDFSVDTASLEGMVEYVPEALLTPEEFAAADNIQFGHPHREYQYCTSRITVKVPPGSYMIFRSSVDFSSLLYVNGELLLSAGQPGDSRETTVPGARYFFLPAQPDENGTITIIQQASNFVHRESGGHGLIQIGSPEQMDSFILRELWPKTIVMGCYLVLFVVHLVLYFLQRGYPQNLLFSLFCLTWFLRAGVTGHKMLLAAVPWLSWQMAFRIEYLSVPLTGILMIWFLHRVFPGVLHRWFPPAASGLLGAFALFYLFGDTLPMSHTLVALEIIMGGMALYILVRLATKQRHIQTEQAVVLLGFGFFLFPFLWDALYYNGIRLIPNFHFAISELAMTVFVLFGMVAMVYGTMREVAAAKENERVALLEAEALRRDALLKEALHKAIPEGHLVERGPLTLNTLAAQGYLNGEDMLLAPKEFALLHLLMQHEGQALDRQRLYEEVWKQPMGADTQAMRSVISRLRKKLAGSGFVIQYDRGRGYLLVAEQQNYTE